MAGHLPRNQFEAGDQALALRGGELVERTPERAGSFLQAFGHYALLTSSHGQDGPPPVGWIVLAAEQAGLLELDCYKTCGLDIHVMATSKFRDGHRSPQSDAEQGARVPLAKAVFPHRAAEAEPMVRFVHTTRLVSTHDRRELENGGEEALQVLVKHARQVVHGDRPRSDGHQFQRPSSCAIDGTNSVRTKNVSSNTPKAMLKPSC